MSMEKNKFMDRRCKIRKSTVKELMKSAPSITRGQSSLLREDPMEKSDHGLDWLPQAWQD